MSVVVVARDRLILAVALLLAVAGATSADFSWCFPSASWHGENTYLSWQDSAAYLDCTVARPCLAQAPSILHLPPLRSDVFTPVTSGPTNGTSASSCADKCAAAVSACEVDPDVPRSQAQPAFDCVYRRLVDTCTPGCTAVDRDAPIDCGYVAFVEPTQPAETTQSSGAPPQASDDESTTPPTPPSSSDGSPATEEGSDDLKHKTPKPGLVAGIAATCAVGAAAGVGALVYASTKAAAIGTSANAPLTSTINPTFLPADEEVAAALGNHTGAIIGGTVGSTVAVGTILASAYYRSETNANAGASPMPAEDRNLPTSMRSQQIRRSNIFESPVSTDGQSDLIGPDNDEGVSPIDDNDFNGPSDPAILPSRVPQTRLRRDPNQSNDSSIVFVLPENRRQ